MVEKFTHLDTGDIETTESFFSNRFLRARIESGHPSNEGLDLIFEENRSSEWQEQHWKQAKDNQLKYDEDVNQYITLILSDLVKGRSQTLINKYIVSMDADAGQTVVEASERSKSFLFIGLTQIISCLIWGCCDQIQIFLEMPILIKVGFITHQPLQV